MITLPSGKQIKVKVTINGQEQELDISTKIAEIVPQLSLPSFLDVIRNTSVQDPKTFSNVQFRALAKSEPKTTYRNGAYVIEPSSLDKNSTKINIVQITPSQIAEKIGLDNIDLNQTDSQTIIAQTIANWIPQVISNIEVNACENMIYAAQEFQKKIVKEKSSATTFKEGAHVQEINLTADSAYNALSDLKNSFTKIGLPNAKTNIDRGFKHATGISKTNIFVLVSPEFLDTICQKQGVFASDSGLELFKMMGIKNLLGLNVMEIPILPDKVHAIAIITGPLGSYGKGDVADGQYFNIVQDATWSKNKTIEMEKTFYSGVVYDQLIFAIVENGAVFTKPELYSANIASTRVIQSESYYQTPMSNIEQMSDEVQQKASNSIFQKAKNKLNGVVDKMSNLGENKDNTSDNNQEVEPNQNKDEK